MRPLSGLATFCFTRLSGLIDFPTPLSVHESVRYVSYSFQHPIPWLFSYSCCESNKSIIRCAIRHLLMLPFLFLLLFTILQIVPPDATLTGTPAPAPSTASATPTGTAAAPAPSTAAAAAPAPSTASAFASRFVVHHIYNTVALLAQPICHTLHIIVFISRH